MVRIKRIKDDACVCIKKEVDLWTQKETLNKTLRYFDFKFNKISSLIKFLLKLLILAERF